jgi:NAD+ synthase (glutamine-hydrolysing)
MFDDQRYFLPGRELEEKLGYKSKSLLDPLIVHYQGETISFGIEVCEDMWDQAYGFSPSTEYLKQGVDILVNISASPWTLNKQQSRLEVMSAHAKVPFIFVNKVGAENNGKNVIFFEGSSLVMNAQGNIIASANDKGLSECLITRLDSLASSEKTPDKLYHMLIQAIRYIDELWFPQKNAWIIGLSGGIDSAVNAALLSIALGKDRVKAFSLPSQYNSEKTKNNSRHIANMLNIFFQEIPIDPLVDAYLQTLGDVSSLTKENIQARVRGNVLMAKAAEANGVVVNNGNKIEIAIGYTTLYGDSIGALAPLGDLTKVQVNELAKTINTLQNATIIPTNLIATEQDGVLHFQTPPSAELKDKQIDPMKWGYHDALIDHLFRFPSLAPERWQRMFIEATFPEPIQKLLAHYNLLQGEAFIQDLEWILRLWNQSYFKRVQLPPNIIVSTGAFGYDYREAQMPYEKTLVYEQLKQKILSIKQYSK